MPEHRLLLLENAEPLVTMNVEREVFNPGWVASKDGLIVAVGEGRVPDVIDGSAKEGWHRRNAAGCVVLPGLINTHHHSPPRPAPLQRVVSWRHPRAKVLEAGSRRLLRCIHQ